jgi:ribosomal protein S18 acetylase RimI-like enzyme
MDPTTKSQPAADADQPTIRSLQAGDRAALENLLARIPQFDPQDVAIAGELLAITLDQPDQKDYRFLVAAAADGTVQGFICYGPTPLTEGTYDLYWIGVDPGCAGLGLGTRLLREMEARLRAAGARLVVIETASTPAYAAARSFYLKNGCRLAETLRDFYRPGEHRLTYTRCL